MNVQILSKSIANGLNFESIVVCMFNFDFNLYSSIVGNSNAFL